MLLYIFGKGEVLTVKDTVDIEYLWKDRKRIFFGLPWTFTRYSLSEDRLFISKGFFSIHEDEVRLYRIMDISLTRNLWQRMFNLGTIKIVSADKTLGNFDLKNIKNPRSVKEQLSKKVEEIRVAKRVSNREYMADMENEEEGLLE